jgi:hypothetical protein
MYAEAGIRMPKAPSKKQQPLIKAKKTIFANDDVPSMYRNYVSASSSVLDAKLIFSEMLEADKDQVVVKKNLAVYMSPRVAKSVAELLSTIISDYERKFGGLQTHMSFPERGNKKLYANYYFPHRKRR